MIKYALVCDAGHDFDSWFPDGPAYDKQVRRGLIACPECGSTHVAKAIMAPAIVSRSARPPAERPAGETPARPVALID